jgi:hypothetical protein
LSLRSTCPQLQLELEPLSRIPGTASDAALLGTAVVGSNSATSAAGTDSGAGLRVARPRRGTVDMEFWLALKKRRAAGDPQRRRVYDWQRAALGRLMDEPLLGQARSRRITQRSAREGALTYLTHLWTRYAPSFAPYYRGIPYLRVGFATGYRGSPHGRGLRYGAYAVPHRHQIYCRLASLRRTTLVHEVCHLFIWGEGHGAAFCAALVRLWEQEFGIRCQHALALAASMRVAVDAAPVESVRSDPR